MRTSTFRDLIGLFERSRHGIAGWELFRQVEDAGRLITERWLIESGQAEMIPVEFEDRLVPVVLVEDDDGEAYRYRSPSTQRWQVVERSQAAIYKVDTSRFLHFTADLLAVDREQRAGIRKPALNQSLWSLGPISLDESSLPVWLVRGFATQVAEVFGFFQDPRWSDDGLILTCGTGWPGYLTLPRRYRVASLPALLVETSPVATIDWTLLHRLLMGAAAPDGAVTRLLKALKTRGGIDLDGQFVPLTRQQQAIFLALLEHTDHEMSKDALQKAVGSQALDFKPVAAFRRIPAVYARYIRYRPDDDVYQLILPD